MTVLTLSSIEGNNQCQKRARRGKHVRNHYTFGVVAVSQASLQLDAELVKWQGRPLGEYRFLFLEAYYEQVREDGQVRNLAVLVAVGINYRL